MSRRGRRSHRLYPLVIILAVAVVSLRSHWQVVPEAVVLAAGADEVCTVSAVGDGDSVTADCPSGEVRVRVWGIDAPEMGQAPWGERAKRALQARIPRTVRLEVLDVDPYERSVARIWDGERDVGLSMVDDGMAIVYRRFNDDDRYAQAESGARKRRLGIWAEPGDQQRPAAWRRVNPRGESGRT